LTSYPIPYTLLQSDLLVFCKLKAWNWKAICNKLSRDPLDAEAQWARLKPAASTIKDMRKSVAATSARSFASSRSDPTSTTTKNRQEDSAPSRSVPDAGGGRGGQLKQQQKQQKQPDRAPLVWTDLMVQ
jgi:hypothetical protein